MTERLAFLRRALLVVSLALAARVEAGDVPVVRSFSAAPGQVELVLSAPASFQLAFLSGSLGRGQADRCYVDVSPASINRQIRPVLDVQAGPMRRVRMSQFNADTVRVVLDLRSVQQCQVSPLTGPDRIIITAGRTQNTAEEELFDVPPPVAEQATPEVRKDRRSTARRVPPPPRRAEPKRQKEHPSRLNFAAMGSGSEGSTAVNWQMSAVPWVQAVPLPEVTQATASSGLALPQTEHVPDVQPQAEHARDFGAEPLLQTWQRLSLALRPFSPLPFLPGWSLAHACRDVGCNISGQLDGGVHTVNLQKSEENLHHAPSPIKRLLAEILTGGVIMHDIWTLAMVMGLLCSFLGGGAVALLFSGKGRKEKKADGWKQRMAHLEEAVNRAGVINNSFFHGLEILQKRLESLLTQADWAEQNLRRLLAQTTPAGGEKSGAREEHYATAALLLAEGDSAQQVARVLKLPLARVRLLQELQHEIKKEKDADPQEKGASKNNRGREVALMNGLATRRNGSSHDGIHLAVQE